MAKMFKDWGKKKKDTENSSENIIEEKEGMAVKYNDDIVKETPEEIQPEIVDFNDENEESAILEEIKEEVKINTQNISRAQLRVLQRLGKLPR